MTEEQWLERYGPWAVVTGASEGIGRATARGIAERGANVLLVARREGRLRRLAAELSATYGVYTRVAAVDLADPDGWRAVVEAAEELDVGLLVAAAGFGTSGHLIANSLDNELQMVDVNCRSVLALTYAFGRQLAMRGRGGLVLMSSLVGFQGVPRAANYAATKAYVQTLAEGLHQELAPYGVDVLSSAPGPVESGFAERARIRLGSALEPETVAEGTLRALGHRTTIRPGGLSKLLEASLALLPRFLRVRVLGRVMGGMTQHRPAPALPKAPRVALGSGEWGE